MSADRLPTPDRVLAIGAHPDDVEFGAGATLARWAGIGADVRILVLTDGSKGTWEQGDDLAELVARRRREQGAAADVLGARGVEFAGYVDGELENGHAERAFLAAAVRSLRPTIVLGHDPWKRYRLHPDHRAAGFLTLDSLVAARDPHFFPEQLSRGGLVPHRPDAVLLYEAEEPDHAESTGEYLDRKVAALLEHRSQWRSTMGITGDDGREAFAARVRADAKTAGDGEPAEVFKLLDV